MKSGKNLDYGNPSPSDITLGDIAHNLAHICRFNGATSGFYSVAEHSIGVTTVYHFMRVGLRGLGDPPPPSIKWALMHDAHEAYIGDVITPLKVLFQDGVYARLCANIDWAIREKLEIAAPLVGSQTAVELSDTIMLSAEMKRFFPTLPRRTDFPSEFGYLVSAADDLIRLLSPREAEEEFLRFCAVHGIKEK
jgi:hypothetical protein